MTTPKKMMKKVLKDLVPSPQIEFWVPAFVELQNEVGEERFMYEEIIALLLESGAVRKV
jgi:hypothetical protein